MSPEPQRPTAARSVADVNKAIRELWADGVLPEDRRPEYERLVVEWAEAYKAERAAQAGAELAA